MLNELNEILNPVNRIQKEGQGDKTIWILVFLLWIISIIIVYSASGIMLINTNVKGTSFLIKQGAFIIIGFLIVFYLHKIHYNVFLKISFPLYIISIALLIITFFVGEEINGAKRWLNIPFVNIKFQPSDIGKIATVLYLSKKISINQREKLDYKSFFKTFIIPILIMSALIMPENLSTSLLIIVISLILLFIGRADLKNIVKTIFFIFIIPIATIVTISTYYYDKEQKKQKTLPNYLQINRVSTWISRVQTFIYKDNSEHNYQTQQAKIAIVKGGFFGTGPGNSEQRYFLPSSYADFIYSIFVEEYGIVGGGIVLILYVLFFFRTIRICSRCEYAFGSFVAIGLSLMLILQAFLNVCVNVGLVPNTGVTLPLISMGGTSYLVSCFAIAIILSVAKHNKNDDNCIESENK